MPSLVLNSSGDDGAEVVDVPYALTDLVNVRSRVGRDLTSNQTEQISVLIAQASIGIYACLGKPLAWVPPDTSKPVLAMMAIEMVHRVFVNPGDLQRRSEQIGTYRLDEMFAARGASAPGILPTPAEELMLRRVVFGSNTTSVKVPSQATEYADLIWPEMEVEWALWYSSPDPSVWR